MSTVLLTCDDWGMCTLVTLALGIHGTAVCCAANGREAREILTREQIDLVILDLETRGLDGTLMLQSARRDGFKGPILVLSEFGAGPAARELAADVALSKPFDPEELIVMTRELLGRTTKAGQ